MRRGSGGEQHPVFGFEADVETGVSTDLLELFELWATRLDLRSQHHFDELPDEGGLGDLLSLRERAENCFHFGANPELDECVIGHDAHCVTRAAGRLSCIDTVFAQKLNICAAANHRDAREVIRCMNRMDPVW